MKVVIIISGLIIILLAGFYYYPTIIYYSSPSAIYLRLSKEEYEPYSDLYFKTTSTCRNIKKQLLKTIHLPINKSYGLVPDLQHKAYVNGCYKQTKKCRDAVLSNNASKAKLYELFPYWYKRRDWNVVDRLKYEDLHGETVVKVWETNSEIEAHCKKNIFRILWQILLFI